jgi:putative peptidoglycan lipid II flippase
VLLNLAMILAAWQGAPWLAERGIQPIYALAGGVIAGGVLQLSVQMLALRRIGLLPAIGWRWAHIRQAWDDPATRRVATLMLPALLGVSVAHISTVINTQIASHLSAGSVSWLTYADRLMEFPTALLGVALGVVLTPQLAAAKAADDGVRYSAMLDWGCVWWSCWRFPARLPCWSSPSRWWPCSTTTARFPTATCSRPPMP